ncbi:MAG TPA: MFS transporter [Noviherbaspirillum sp.]
MNTIAARLEQKPFLTFVICTAVILTVSMGVRHTFGLFLPYLTEQNGWGREVFAFAVGLQNLMWGVAQPFAGALGDRFGAHRVMLGGAVLYAVGLFGMAFSTTPLMLSLTCGVLIGIAHACTTYSIAFGALGRRVTPDKRSKFMGLISAAGSFGQFAMVPLGQIAISSLGTTTTLFILAAAVLLILPLSSGLREAPRAQTGSHQVAPQSTISALREALGHRSFLLLVLGYFVCGFQVVFIGVHLPAYLRDGQLPSSVAPTALALIGLFNIFGSYAVGLLGSVIPQKMILSSIYLLRSVVIVIFLAVPLSPLSVYVFSACMGVLWLSTVPPTNGIIARIFGVTHFSMLSGVAFFSHQIGSFLGVWLGGYWYDRAGNYGPVWDFIVLAGLVAAVLHLPIREKPVVRTASAGA